MNVEWNGHMYLQLSHIYKLSESKLEMDVYWIRMHDTLAQKAPWLHECLSTRVVRYGQY